MANPGVFFPDAIVELIKGFEETLADETARNAILENQNRELKERNTELEERMFSPIRF